MRLALCGLAVALAGASAANAAVYSGPGGPIPDGPDSTGANFNEAAFTIDVAGDGGTVQSVNAVVLTNLTHSWYGDLQIVLRGPNGATANLLSAPDNDGTNLNGTYTFVVDPGVPTLPEVAAQFGNDEDVPGSRYAISGYTDANTPGPRTSYAPLIGAPVDGAWTILLRDYYTNDVGAVGSWSLDLTSSVIPEPTSLAALAAAGLLTLRRRPAP